MAPACNFGFGIEWQAGFGRLDFEGLSRFAESYLQAKTAWGTLSEGGWSAGLVAGVTRRKLDVADHKWDNPYVTIPFSVRLDEALTIVHVNVGWARERALGRDFTTWGLAAERTLASQLTLLAEVFGVDRASPFWRIGARYPAIKDRLDLDLSVVTRSGGSRSDRLVSIGFHAQTPPFLP